MDPMRDHFVDGRQIPQFVHALMYELCTEVQPLTKDSGRGSAW